MWGLKLKGAQFEEQGIDRYMEKRDMDCKQLQFEAHQGHQIHGHGMKEMSL